MIYSKRPSERIQTNTRQRRQRPCPRLHRYDNQYVHVSRIYPPRELQGYSERYHDFVPKYRTRYDRQDLSRLWSKVCEWLEIAHVRLRYNSHSEKENVRSTLSILSRSLCETISFVDGIKEIYTYKGKKNGCCFISCSDGRFAGSSESI